MRAAHGGAVLLCALFVLGCGDERAPWSGFPIFPPDAGGFEIPPDIASSLLAAQAAFAKQLAVEQGLVDAGSESSSVTSPAGPMRATAGAAAPRMTRRDEQEDEPEKGEEATPRPAKDAGTVNTNAGTEAPPTAANAGTEAPPTAANAGAGGVAGAATTSADAGTPVTNTDAGMTTTPTDAGAPTTANPETPDASIPATQTPEVDSGTASSDADSGN